MTLVMGGTRPKALAPSLAVLLSATIWLLGTAPTLPAALHVGGDALLHGVSYAVLAATTAEALANLRWGPSPPLGAVLYAMGHGAALEALQSLAPRRRAQWHDLLADAAGALLGAGGWWVWRRR